MPTNPDPFEPMQAHMRVHVRAMTGSDEIAGVELFALLRMASNLFENQAVEKGSPYDLSGPRLGLLMRLYGEECEGRQAGLTPTHLSRSDKVSKNTISSHLRGLEAQGLITRQIDAADKRLFRIRLTDTGRQVVQSSAPRHIQRLNQMAAALLPEEQALLNALLRKLIRPLIACSLPQGGLPESDGR